jgi:hypothetical protein
VRAVTVDQFKAEMTAARRAYEKFVVCLEKTPDEFEASLKSLLRKALEAFEKRPPGMRHGIALDRYVTVIISQADSDRPFCGIYFNLHSPYQKQLARTATESPDPSGTEDS